MVDHIYQALASDKLLMERNKHILIPEKYGWDTVHCYTVEPLASDLEDEKPATYATKDRC